MADIKPSIAISELDELNVSYGESINPETLLLVTDPATKISKKMKYISLENTLVKSTNLDNCLVAVDNLSMDLEELSSKSLMVGENVSSDHWIICSTKDSAASYIKKSSNIPDYDKTDPHVLYGILQDNHANVISGAASSVSTLLSVAFENNTFKKINNTFKKIKVNNLTANTEKVTNLTATKLTSNELEINGKGNIIDFINSSIEHMASFYVTKDVQGNAFQTYNQLST